MRAFGQVALEFLKNEDGATAVEYAIVVALIAMGVVGQVGPLVSNSTKTFHTVSNTLATGS